MLERLPEFLLIEILLLLPIKLLLQFKIVCKTWYNIIKTPYFISKHLQLEPNRGRHNNCIIAQFVVVLPSGELEPHMLWLDDESDKDNTIHDYLTLQHGRPPYNYDLYGPCDGLYFAQELMGERCIWNPALEQTKKLPPIIMKPDMPSNIEYCGENCGFGFDPVTVDYKVVVIKGYKKLTDNVYYADLNYPLSILIYSLKKDSWRYVGDLSKTYYLSNHSSYTFVKENYYWLGSSDNIYPFKFDVIIVVNLAKEATKEIGLPEMRLKGSITYESYSESLMVYRNSIALAIHYKDKGNLDIWTLNERCWSKDLSIELDFDFRNVFGDYCLHDKRVLLFGYWDELYLYDIDTKEAWIHPYDYYKNSHYCKIVSTYMESLIPLNDQEFWIQWQKIE